MDQQFCMSRMVSWDTMIIDLLLFLWMSLKGHSEGHFTDRMPLISSGPASYGKILSIRWVWLTIILSEIYITIRKPGTNATVPWSMKHEIKGWCPNVQIQLASDLCLCYKSKILLFMLYNLPQPGSYPCSIWNNLLWVIKYVYGITIYGVIKKWHMRDAV